MPAIAIQGSQVVYSDHGSGPAAVLLHSSAGTRGQWRSLTELLDGKRRVLAPDLRGYGESAARPGEPDLADEAAIVGALAACAGGRIDLVGHSYGGAVALRFALEQPELVRSLTLIEPVAFHLLRQDWAGRDWLLAEVQAIAAAVEPFEFDTIYGAWWGRVIPSGAKDVVRRSAERYGRALRGELHGISATRPART